jgi:hypothetical protein
MNTITESTEPVVYPTADGRVVIKVVDNRNGGATVSLDASNARRFMRDLKRVIEQAEDDMAEDT